MRRLVISDTHFGHTNIIRYCNRPEDHEQQIIENWKNATADGDCITYHLGDVTIGWKEEQLKNVLSQIGGTIVLVRGNHDGWSDSKFMRCGFDVVCDAITVGDVLLTHEPTFICGGVHKYNLHGHIHNIPYEHAVNSFGGTYQVFNDGKHFLYSPEVQKYVPVVLEKLVKRGG